MKSFTQHFFAALLLMGSATAQTYLSPSEIILSPDSQRLHIISETDNKLLTFDVATQSVLEPLHLPAAPTGLTRNNDGSLLFISGGGSAGKVWVVRDGKIVQEIEAGHTPVSPILSPDEKTLYICNRFDNEIIFIDLPSGEIRERVTVVREPVTSDLTADGTYLFVGNLLPDGRADGEYIASKISVIHTGTKEVTTIPLVNGAEGVRGLKISPDGQYAFATHMMARYLVPTTQLERGWVSTDAISVIRVSDRSLQHTVLLDDVDQGFANPWAIGFSNEGKTLVVSSAGNHEISLIDLPAMMQKIKEISAPNQPTHLDAHNNLSFLSGIRKRIKLNGKGPRALATHGEFIYITHYFSDALEIIRLSKHGSLRRGSFPLGPKQPLTPERQGEINFNDASLCFQNWLSCATCHPDARVDALNWDLLNDGMGNPKNAKSMLLAHKTPRAMWLGVRADAETGVRAGIKHIQFSVRPEEDAAAIDAYLKSLTPVPSPYLVKGELSESAQRGKELFNRMDCSSCHPAPLFTDLNRYDVKTTKGQDTGKKVDVPSLVEVWRTAPYLHDGRAATIPDLLRTEEHAGIFESTNGLSDSERADLAAYVLSL